MMRYHPKAVNNGKKPFQPHIILGKYYRPDPNPKYAQQDHRQSISCLKKPLNVSDAPASLSYTSQLEAKITKLKHDNTRLLGELLQANTEKTKIEQSKTDAPHKSSLSLYCEEHNIHSFPENPAEALRGLLAEFNIKESSTDIIRDVREHR